MAKTYRAIRDVSIPKPVALVDENKPDGDWVVEGATYPAGSLISEEWMTPRDRKRAESGDLEHLLQSSDEEIPEGYVTGGVFNEPERGVFIAEHEAEATALEVGGHIVVPKEQQMEVLSSSLPHQRKYQEAAEEAGATHRPVLEHLQQERERVPDDFLVGGETGAGVPHNRGTEESREQALEDARSDNSDDSDSDEAEPSRAAPGSGQQQAETQTVSQT